MRSDQAHWYERLWTRRIRGLFALPVQVFLQSRPPDKLKGRVIGTMNLVNWIAIILSGEVVDAGLFDGDDAAAGEADAV